MATMKFFIISVFAVAAVLVLSVATQIDLDLLSLQNMIRSRPYSGPLIFGLIYALLIVFLLPTAPLNLFAGFIWGPLWGSLIVVTSVTVGSVISFMFARSVFYTFFDKYIESPRYLRLQQILERDGWKIMIMIRMNPIFPTGPINYVIGSTKIPFAHFFIPTPIFLIPPSFALAYAGDTVQGLLLNDFNTLEVLWPIILAASLITLIALVSYYFKSKIEKKM